MTSQNKHNWFSIYGEIRTHNKMTKQEFLNLLDQLGLELLGGVDHSSMNDSMYYDED